MIAMVSSIPVAYAKNEYELQTRHEQHPTKKKAVNVNPVINNGFTRTTRKTRAQRRKK